MKKTLVCNVFSSLPRNGEREQKIDGEEWKLQSDDDGLEIDKKG